MDTIGGLKTQAQLEAAREVLDLWWLWIVKGVLAILFGVAAWAWPDLTLATLIWILGAFIVADGIMDIAGMFTQDQLSWGRRMLLVVWGVVQVVGGIVLWAAPGIGVLTLLVIFGVWALATGIFLVVSAFTSDGHLMSPWMQALLGIALAVIGVYLVVEPGDGAVASVWVLGVVAIAHGIAQIMAGFQMRSSCVKRWSPVPPRVRLEPRMLVYRSELR
jgi:uncharacterized membrane protein HdeD (DUF308 family)